MSRPSKGYTQREQIEGRCFECMIYESDNPEETQCRLNRLPYFWETFWYIKHDCDRWTEDDMDKWCSDHPGKDFPYNIGDLKKTHYHVIGYCSSPLLLGRAAIKFDVPSNLVQKVKSIKPAVQYLIHLNHPNKYQYLPELIVTNDTDISEKLKMKVDSNKKAKIIYDFINSNSGYISIQRLCDYCIVNDCWDELRRGQHIFTSLVSEHNYFASKGES